MKILLLNPPAVDNVRIVREGRCMQRQEAWGTSWAPLSLAIIASVLRDAGFTVSLKDCSNDGISVDGLKGIIRDFRPGLLVVNTSTPSIEADLKVARLAKEIDKNAKTIFFGIHITALPEEVFNADADVEFLVSGEPEYAIRDFAITLRDKKALKDVKGLIWKENGKIIRNAARPFIQDLDELPYPAWDLVNIKGYRLPITNRPFLLVLTGRGCPYPCTFCAAKVFYGIEPRLRSPRRIVDEIKHVREKYGVKDFLFWSENSISKRQHIYDISEGIAKEMPGVRWVANGRVDMVDKGLLSAMKKAGCWMVGYGVEAGTDRVLSLMKKNTTVSDIEKAVRLTKESGIETTAHVIVGHPGETKEDILETTKLVRRLDFDYMQVYCSVPFPGSTLYEEAKRSGWINTSDWARFEQNFSVLDTPHLSSGDVMELREAMIKKFYMDPRKILKTLCKIKSPREIIFFLKLAKGFFTSWAK